MPLVFLARSKCSFFCVPYKCEKLANHISKLIAAKFAKILVSLKFNVLIDYIYLMY